MEVNKEQAEKCRDLGATALRTGDYEKAVRMLEKSLRLYSLPGVEALLSHAQSKLKNGGDNSNNNNGSSSGTSSPSNNNNNNSNRRSTSNGYSSTTTDDDDDDVRTSNQRRRQQSTASTASTASSSPPQRQQSTTGADGRAYTDEQVQIIQKILRARTSGRGAHYRVLGLEMGESATENDIKKAYRKISLKVHPDKNSAPGADEAFKAVGLAYATLSDTQKRTIYDRYGDEDPDSNQGMRAAGPFGRRPGGGRGQEVSPEDIFNAFFGGAGMGGPGFHVYSSGFGPGMHFATGGNRWQQQNQQQQRRRNNQQQQGGNPPQNEASANIGTSDESSHVYSTTTVSPGENKYFSLTNKVPFTNRLNTKLTPVKDIPYYVSDKFLRTYYRDRYQLSQVERMVESAYELYLYNECQTQSKYKQSLHRKSATANKNPSTTTPEERARLQSVANEFKLTRCEEYNDLFPNSKRKNTGRQQQQQQRQQHQQQQEATAAS